MMRPISKRMALAAAAAMAATMALAGCESVQNIQRMASSPCHDTKLTLYFESNSETLTSAGQQIVNLTAAHLSSCRVKELSLVGLADPVGSPEINLTLSKHRADSVLNAFVHAGLPVPHYTLVASGDKGAISASGAVVPLRRQVDVIVVVAR